MFTDYMKRVNDLYKAKPNQVLWKYLELPKLLNILSTKCLYFRRLDKFEDKFEGSAPAFALKHVIEGISNVKEIYDSHKKHFYADCWTEFDTVESYAMWKVYSKAYGIAIETSLDKLKKALPDEIEDIKIKYFNFKDINTGSIYDIPYLKDNIYLDGSYIRNFSAIKSLEYEYEKEVRLIVQVNESYENFHPIKLKLGFNQVINRIIINPYADEWFIKLVEDLVIKKYRLNKVKVVKSSIETNY